MIRQTALSCILFALCQPASAGPIYSIHIGGLGGPDWVGNIPGTTEYSDPGHTVTGFHTGTSFQNTVTREWFARVDQGSLHAAGSIDVAGGQPHLWDTVVRSKFAYDDLIIDADTFESTVTVFFELNGTLTEGAGSNSKVIVQGNLDGDIRSLTINGPAEVSGTKSLTFLNVSRGANKFFSLQLETRAAGGVASADFANSLFLATSGPVFSGTSVTNVNSAQAGIVDNQYSLPSNPVPEPSSMALFAFGSLGLVRYARRKRPRQRRPLISLPDQIDQQNSLAASL